MAHRTSGPVDVRGDCHECCPAAVADCSLAGSLPNTLYATFSANGDGSPAGYVAGTAYTLGRTSSSDWAWTGDGHQACVHSGTACVSGSHDPTPAENYAIDHTTCAAAAAVGLTLRLACIPGPPDYYLVGFKFTKCPFDSNVYAALGSAMFGTAILTILSISPVHMRYEWTAADEPGDGTLPGPFGVLDITE